MRRGKFITVYGINNIGKSTHTKRLVRKLDKVGVPAVHVKYPVYDIEPSGPFLNEVLRSGNKQQMSEEELQMWFALNRFQYEKELERLLDNGIWVVAEDYTGTGLAWGAAKGADIEWLLELNKPLLKEDFSLMLDGKRTLAARERGHLHESDDNLANRCQKIHRELAERFGWKVVEVQPLQKNTAALVWNTVNDEFGLV